MTSTYCSGWRLPGLSIGIFVCMVLNRSRTVLASHAHRQESPLKSSGPWHVEQDVLKTACPRAAWPSVYTPSQTDRCDCDCAAPNDNATNTTMNAMTRFISSLSADHHRR